MSPAVQAAAARLAAAAPPLSPASPGEADGRLQEHSAGWAGGVVTAVPIRYRSWHNRLYLLKGPASDAEACTECGSTFRLEHA